MVIDSESSPSMTQLPRLVIAAPGSGHGKTTVATGLMGALRAPELEVAGFKVGPDYIDPGYHTLATGRLGRNLDPYLCGEDQMAPLLLHGAQTPQPADVAVIEGVMGLFDGQIGGDGFASTAHVAGLVRCSGDLGAGHLAHLAYGGCDRSRTQHLRPERPTERRDPQQGRIRTARPTRSPRLCRRPGFEVLGVLPRDAGIEIPSRHLGLVPAAERAEAAETVAELAATDQRSRLTDLDSCRSHGQRRHSQPTPGLPQLTCDHRPSYVRWSRSPPAGPSPSATPRPTSCSALPAANR